MAVFVWASGSNQRTGSSNSIVVDDVAQGEMHEIISNASWSIDISNPVVVAEQSSNIALVRIDSIDGADNYSEVSGEYVYPYSYGRMTVLENLKGDLPMDGGVTFYKVGGTITAEQHYNGLTLAQKERYEGATDGPDMFKYAFSGDVELEVGKVYLAYLKPEVAYRGDSNAYGFICAQGGLREVQIQLDDRSRSNGEARVLNNFTGEWESLADVMYGI